MEPSLELVEHLIITIIKKKNNLTQMQSEKIKICILQREEKR